MTESERNQIAAMREELSALRARVQMLEDFIGPEPELVTASDFIEHVYETFKAYKPPTIEVVDDIKVVKP